MQGIQIRSGLGPICRKQIFDHIDIEEYKLNILEVSCEPVQCRRTN